MKKLTAGIFATLLAVVSTGAANAEIASKGYVDEQVDTVEATVGQHTSQIGTINTTISGYGDIVTRNANEFATAAQGTKADTAVQPTAISDMQVKANLTTNAEWSTEKSADDKYPSNAAVNEAITAATSGLATSGKITEIEGDITTIEGNITDIQGDVTQLQTDVSAKQNKNMGAGAANHIVTTDGTGNITSSATITQGQVAGLNTALDAKADKSALDGKVDANKAISAGTGTKITYDAKGLVTGSASLTASDIPALTTDKITGLDTALAGKVDDAEIADMLTKTEAGSTYETKANASATYETKANASATYATKEEIADLATDENLSLKQDKTDNSLATTNKTVVGAINEVKTQADKGVSDAAAAQSTADTAKSTADSALTKANAAIPAPDGECAKAANKCVLTYNNTVYAWEVIERGTSESSN